MSSFFQQEKSFESFFFESNWFFLMPDQHHQMGLLIEISELYDSNVSCLVNPFFQYYVLKVLIEIKMPKKCGNNIVPKLIQIIHTKTKMFHCKLKNFQQAQKNPVKIVQTENVTYRLYQKVLAAETYMEWNYHILKIINTFNLDISKTVHEILLKF